MKPRLHFGGSIIGAAFLMANSSIGPGFLTQTTVFTKELMASFGFVILASIILDIGAQLNTWRVLTMSGLRAQDLANKLLPGLGFILTALVVFGGFAFNIGNIAGCGLGLNVLTGLDFRVGAAISCVFTLLLFWNKEIGSMLDNFTKIVGSAKILLTLFITVTAAPPLLEAIHHTFIPEKISSKAIITIVGGTVGGYITFSGAHRLLDAGIGGVKDLAQVNRSAMSGIFISGLMRFILFLATFGALAHGAILDANNPAGSVFKFSGGQIGYIIFGIVMWFAAISSVVGASYTSVSFFKTFHPALVKYEKLSISLFIIISTLIFILVGKPVQLLVAAGVINGLILPFALAVVLIAATKKRLMNNYIHPIWMQVFGWFVVVVMGTMSFWALYEYFFKMG